jgi:hypothetical protein
MREIRYRGAGFDMGITGTNIPKSRQPIIKTTCYDLNNVRITIVSLNAAEQTEIPRLG